MNDIEAKKKLRVSVATYNRVLFPHPQNGIFMLALERKATVWKGGNVSVRAQPFGGGVRILNSSGLRAIVQEIHFDSERSKHEQDFRILIHPSKWDLVKQYCLQHLANPNDTEIESGPDRELIEEFEETIHASLKPDQYTALPTGFVMEDNPVWTKNWYAHGYLTVRFYRIFEVHIMDVVLCTSMLTASQTYSDQELGALAVRDFQTGGRGFANSILALPLETVRQSYLALPPEMRYRKIIVEDHELDESVLAVLEGIDVPQYQRQPANFIADRSDEREG